MKLLLVIAVWLAMAMLTAAKRPADEKPGQKVFEGNDKIECSKSTYSLPRAQTRAH